MKYYVRSCTRKMKLSTKLGITFFFTGLLTVCFIWLLPTSTEIEDVKVLAKQSRELSSMGDTEIAALQLGLNPVHLRKLQSYIESKQFRGDGPFAIKPEHIEYCRGKYLTNLEDFNVLSELQSAVVAGSIIKSHMENGLTEECAYLVYLFGVAALKSNTDEIMEARESIFGGSK